MRCSDKCEGTIILRQDRGFESAECNVCHRCVSPESMMSEIDELRAAVAAETERCLRLVTKRLAEKPTEVKGYWLGRAEALECLKQDIEQGPAIRSEEPICGRCGRLARLHHALPCTIRAAVAAERKRIAAVAAAHDLDDWWAELDHLTQLPPAKESPNDPEI